MEEATEDKANNSNNNGGEKIYCPAPSPVKIVPKRPFPTSHFARGYRMETDGESSELARPSAYHNNVGPFRSRSSNSSSAYNNSASTTTTTTTTTTSTSCFASSAYANAGKVRRRAYSAVGASGATAGATALTLHKLPVTYGDGSARRLQDLVHSGSNPSLMDAQSTGPRNWTREFQEILLRPLLERGTELQRLCDDFVATAKQYGEVIIRERHLPYHQKTIKPLEGKGLAGGEKYQVANIFFKFAVNKDDSLYPSDRFAMKVAGHELKGLTALVSCGMILGLSFPLLALIDWRGYRLIATSALPISEETIVYGSCDGGNSVHKKSEEMNNLMEKIAKVLNLKGHYTGLGEFKEWLHGPCDIEGHQGKDGKFYVVDTARIWPCETPDCSVKGGFLFKLLRGEFVSKYGAPLSSDAFTAFGEHDAEVHNAEVQEATRHLFHHVIPEFSAQLPSFKSSLGFTGTHLIEELHRAGINVRHIGRVRARVEDQWSKELLLLEIVSRVLKNELRAEMRSMQGSEEAEYRDLVVAFFNFVFGCGPHSSGFWRTDVKRLIKEQFPQGISPTEEHTEHDLRKNVKMEALYLRLQHLAGVVFHPGLSLCCCEMVHHSPPFTPNFLPEILVKAKHMYAIPRIEADALAELARTKNGQEAIQLYGLSAEAYAHALQLKPDDACVLRNLATVCAELAVLRAQQHGRSAMAEVDRLFAEAYDKLSVCLRLDRNDHKALDRWANALCDHATVLLSLLPGEYTRPSQLLSVAAQRYKAAFRLQPHNRNVLFNWGNSLRKHAHIYENLANVRDSENLLREAMTKYQTCTRLPREKKRDTLIIDTLINWGCALLALSRLEVDKEVATCHVENAKKQFLRAAAVIKCEGLFERDNQQKQSYHAILSYNMAYIAALHADPATATAILRKALPVTTPEHSLMHDGLK